MPRSNVPIDTQREHAKGDRPITAEDYRRAEASYRYQERLAILKQGPGEPTADEIAMAKGDVERFLKETQ